MRIRLRPKRTRLDCDAKTQEIVRYLAHATGLTMPEITRAAIREFAATRTVESWEEVKRRDERRIREIQRIKDRSSTS